MNLIVEKTAFFATAPCFAWELVEICNDISITNLVIFVVTKRTRKRPALAPLARRAQRFDGT